MVRTQSHGRQPGRGCAGTRGISGGSEHQVRADAVKGAGRRRGKTAPPPALKEQGAQQPHPHPDAGRGAASRKQPPRPVPPPTLDDLAAPAPVPLQQLQQAAHDAHPPAPPRRKNLTPVPPPDLVALAAPADGALDESIGDAVPPAAADEPRAAPACLPRLTDRLAANLAESVIDAVLAERADRAREAGSTTGSAAPSPCGDAVHPHSGRRHDDRGPASQAPLPGRKQRRGRSTSGGSDRSGNVRPVVRGQLQQKPWVPAARAPSPRGTRQPAAAQGQVRSAGTRRARLGARQPNAPVDRTQESKPHERVPSPARASPALERCVSASPLGDDADVGGTWPSGLEQLGLLVDAIDGLCPEHRDALGSLTGSPLQRYRTFLATASSLSPFSTLADVTMMSRASPGVAAAVQDLARRASRAAAAAAARDVSQTLSNPNQSTLEFTLSPSLQATHTLLSGTDILRELLPRRATPTPPPDAVPPTHAMPSAAAPPANTADASPVGIEAATSSTAQAPPGTTVPTADVPCAAEAVGGAMDARDMDEDIAGGTRDTACSDMPSDIDGQLRVVFHRFCGFSSATKGSYDMTHANFTKFLVDTDVVGPMFSCDAVDDLFARLKPRHSRTITYSHFRGGGVGALATALGLTPRGVAERILAAVKPGSHRRAMYTDAGSGSAGSSHFCDSLEAWGMAVDTEAVAAVAAAAAAATTQRAPQPRRGRWGSAPSLSSTIKRARPLVRTPDTGGLSGTPGTLRRRAGSCVGRLPQLEGPLATTDTHHTATGTRRRAQSTSRAATPSSHAAPTRHTTRGVAAIDAAPTLGQRVELRKRTPLGSISANIPTTRAAKGKAACAPTRRTQPGPSSDVPAGSGDADPANRSPTPTRPCDVLQAASHASRIRQLRSRSGSASSAQQSAGGGRWADAPPSSSSESPPAQVWAGSVADRPPLPAPLPLQAMRSGSAAEREGATGDLHTSPMVVPIQHRRSLHQSASPASTSPSCVKPHPKRSLAGVPHIGTRLLVRPPSCSSSGTGHADEHELDFDLPDIDGPVDFGQTFRLSRPVTTVQFP